MCPMPLVAMVAQIWDQWFRAHDLAEDGDISGCSIACSMLQDVQSVVQDVLAALVAEAVHEVKGLVMVA